MKIDKKNKNASEMTPLTALQILLIFLLLLFIDSFTYDGGHMVKTGLPIS